MLRFLGELILIVIAISALRSVLASVQRIFSGIIPPRRPDGPQAPRETNTRTPPAAPAATALEQDPVCGTYVSVDSSLKRIIGGKVYHFCSEACKDRFSAS
jgi:YHS domain-containing protein